MLGQSGDNSYYQEQYYIIHTGASGFPVQDSVRLFYEEDEFSRMIPEGKAFLSIGNKFHIQKRLLLSNLKELYVAYRERYPDHKISLSKFCKLRPK